MSDKNYILVPKDELENLMKILMDSKVDGFKKTVAAANFNAQYVKGK